MVKYKIIDNFLSDADFSTLINNISPLPLDSPYPVAKPSFGWDYTHCQLKEFNEEAKGWVKSTTNDEQDRFKKVTDIQVLDPIHDWYMQHMVQTGNYYSNAMQYFGALLGRINPLALFQIRANLTVQQEKRGRTIFHIDYKGAHATSMITSIFYLNTTNGPTILEDGTEIECRANRLVSYGYQTYHAAVLCTDQPYRIVINFNYFKDEENDETPNSERV